MKKKKMKKDNFLIEMLDLMRLCVFSLMLVYIFVNLVFKPVEVIGDSMYPTLASGEQGVSNVFSRITFNINRFDVVVVKEPLSGDLWVKRVIGMPNEVVEFKDDILYIDGKKIDEPYLNKEYKEKIIKDQGNFTNNFKSRKLGNDEYFLVGDNRHVSKDSRFRGPFHESEIVSKGVYIYYPFRDMKVVN